MTVFDCPLFNVMFSGLSSTSKSAFPVPEPPEFSTVTSILCSISFELQLSPLSKLPLILTLTSPLLSLETESVSRSISTNPVSPESILELKLPSLASKNDSFSITSIPFILKSCSALFSTSILTVLLSFSSTNISESSILKSSQTAFPPLPPSFTTVTLKGALASSLLHTSPLSNSPSSSISTVLVWELPPLSASITISRSTLSPASMKFPSSSSAFSTTILNGPVPTRLMFCISKSSLLLFLTSMKNVLLLPSLTLTSSVCMSRSPQTPSFPFPLSLTTLTSNVSVEEWPSGSLAVSLIVFVPTLSSFGALQLNHLSNPASSSMKQFTRFGSLCVIEKSSLSSTVSLSVVMLQRSKILSSASWFSSSVISWNPENIGAFPWLPSLSTKTLNVSVSLLP